MRTSWGPFEEANKQVHLQGFKIGKEFKNWCISRKNLTIYYPILPKYDLELVINKLMICRKLVYTASRILCYLPATVIAE
jgi:hypothetical protein